MVNAIVIYNSRGGNTKKVAEKIAEGLGGDCVDYKSIPKKLEIYDLLVLGTWPMMFRVSGTGKRWLKKLSKKKLDGKNIALFFTSAGPDEPIPKEENKLIKEKVYETMEEIITKKNKLTILEERFYCKGALRIFGKVTANEGHPTEEDLEKAKKFGELLKEKFNS